MNQRGFATSFQFMQVRNRPKHKSRPTEQVIKSHNNLLKKLTEYKYLDRFHSTNDDDIYFAKKVLNVKLPTKLSRQNFRLAIIHIGI